MNSYTVFPLKAESTHPQGVIQGQAGHSDVPFQSFQAYFGKRFAERQKDGTKQTHIGASQERWTAAR